MSPLLFLLLALGLSIVGSLIVVIWNHRPTGFDHGIKSFNREMEALAPEHPRDATSGRSDSRPPVDRDHPGVRQIDPPMED